MSTIKSLNLTGLVKCCRYGWLPLCKSAVRRIALASVIRATTSVEKMLYRMRIRVEREHLVQFKRPMEVPLPNTIHLTHPETKSQIYLVGLLPEGKVTSVELAGFIQKKKPNYVFLSPLSGFSIIKSARKERPQKELSVKSAVMAARSIGAKATILPRALPTLPPLQILQTIFSRSAEIPPHLLPYDPFFHAVLEGSQDIRTFRKIHAACKARPNGVIVCVVDLPSVPFLHTLLTNPSLVSPTLRTVNFKTVGKLCQEGEQKEDVSLWDQMQHFVERMFVKAGKATPSPSPSATAATKTVAPTAKASGKSPSRSPSKSGKSRKRQDPDTIKRLAIAYWLLSQGRDVRNPLFLTKTLTSGKEVLRVAKSRSARKFVQEIKDLNKASAFSSEKFNKRYIYDEWQNIMYTFCNSILLANKKQSLEYPYLKNCFQ